MTIKQYQKLQKIIGQALEELEKEAIAGGLNVLSSAYEELVLKAKEKIIENQGFTPEEYRAMSLSGDTLIDETIAKNSVIKETLRRVEELQQTHIPTEEEITNIANQVAEEVSTRVATEVAKQYIKAPEIINQIVKEIVIKQDIDLSPLEETVESLNERVTAVEDKEVKATEVRDKLETLKDDERLDESAIKGLDKREGKLTDSITKRAFEIVQHQTSFLINKVANLQAQGTGGGGTSLPSQVGNNGKFLTTNGTDPSWAALAGGGDMLAATYDPAGVSEQLVGLTATQTLTNKTLTSPVLTTPTLGVASATSVNKVAITAPATSSTLTIADGQTLTVNGSATITNGTHSGTNTGDQTTVSGNAGTATALQNARTIGGTSFDGTANITVATATGGFTVSGGNLALGTNSVTLTGSVGATGARATKVWATDIESTAMPTVGGTAILSSLTAPTFTTIEMGAGQTDTTLSRASAGDVNVEGNRIFRVGGADVPVADGGTGSSTAAGAVTALGLDNTKIASVGITIDGAGVAITTGIKGDIMIPYACTINSVTMLADQSGSIVVDIWKDTYANYPATVADTITASAKPTITTATKSQDATLTGWTTSVTAGDTIRFNVDSATTITRLALILKVTKT